MAVVCIQNGFLTVEDGDELASLRAVARGRNKSKTVGCCIGGTRFFTEEDDTEIIDKSGESATVDRLSMVLMSGKLLPDAGRDAAGTVAQESFEIMPHLDSAPSFERNHGLELLADHYRWKAGRTLSDSISTTAESDLWEDSAASSAASRRSSFCVEEQLDLVSITVPPVALEGESRSCDSLGHTPKNSGPAEEFSESNREAPPTTMMIRNFPHRYCQKSFVAELESMGFSGSFDFLYLPMDKRTHCSLGYCFVNFVDHHWAAKCAEVFQNHAFEQQHTGKQKTARVSSAHIQGLDANISYYKNKGVIGGSGRHSGPWFDRKLLAQV